MKTVLNPGLNKAIELLKNKQEKCRGMGELITTGIDISIKVLEEYRDCCLRLHYEEN